MRANRRRDTGPERLLRAALRREGLRGYRLAVANLPGRPDIAFPRLRLAIFVHGCFWHRCPHCQPPLPKAHRAFWRRKFELNSERDERKRRHLEAAGWDVLEFWECKVKEDPAGEACRVRQMLERLGSAAVVDEAAAERADARRLSARKGTHG
jgi:DNA mismatch endonuclease (patch repair protein)